MAEYSVTVAGMKFGGNKPEFAVVEKEAYTISASDTGIYVICSDGYELPQGKANDWVFFEIDGVGFGWDFSPYSFSFRYDQAKKQSIIDELERGLDRHFERGIKA